MFIYNEHGSPHDYRRLSVPASRQLLASKYEIGELHGQGGIGSSLGLLLLNWVEFMCAAHLLWSFGRSALLPLWLLVSLIVNAIGAVLDKIDTTEKFYNNVWLLGLRKS